MKKKCFCCNRSLFFWQKKVSIGVYLYHKKCSKKLGKQKMDQENKIVIEDATLRSLRGLGYIK